MKGYDAWKTRSDLDDAGFMQFEQDPGEREEQASECDCCGRLKAGCEDVIAAGGLDTHACPECRGHDPLDY